MYLSFNKKQLYLLLLSIIFTTILGLFTLLWARQKISHKAYVCHNLEQKLKELNRKNSFLEAKIAQVHNPKILIAKADKDLAPPQSRQVVWSKNHLPREKFRLPESSHYTIAFNIPSI